MSKHNRKNNRQNKRDSSRKNKARDIERRKARNNKTAVIDHELAVADAETRALIDEINWLLSN